MLFFLEYKYIVFIVGSLIYSISKIIVPSVESSHFDVVTWDLSCNGGDVSVCDDTSQSYMED
jgi:hypothetical protein